MKYSEKSDVAKSVIIVAKNGFGLKMPIIYDDVASFPF